MTAEALALGYPPRGKAWFSAVVIFLIAAIATADRMAISMLIGPIKREFAIGDFQASLLVGLAFTLFYILFLVPIGWLADRVSRRKVLAVCLVIWSLATIACGFAGSFISLFVLRMLVGSGEAGMAPCVHGIIGSSFPRHKLAKPLALQGIGFQVGGAAGIAAAGAIMAAGAQGAFSNWPVLGDMAAWRISFVLIGVPGLLAVALVPLLQDRGTDQAAAFGTGVGLWEFLRANAAISTLALLAGGFSAAGLGAITGWLPEFMQRTLGMSPIGAGATMGSFLLFAALVGQGGFSVLVDFCAARGMHDAPVRLGIVPTALAVPLCWLGWQADSEAAFLPWLAAILLCIAPGNAINNTVVQMIAPPQLRSRLSSLMILVISVIGFSGGPALVGWLSEYVVGEERLGLALQLATAGGLAIAVVLLALLRPRLAAYVAQQEGTAP
ncbi:MAG: MFS transporter [Novosphingobium sp.]